MANPDKLKNAPAKIGINKFKTGTIVFIKYFDNKDNFDFGYILEKGDKGVNVQNYLIYNITRGRNEIIPDYQLKTINDIQDIIKKIKESRDD